MRAADPKQAVINKLTDSNPQMKREERGILAKSESILFFKEKHHQYVHTYVVRYINTTNQQWYYTSLVVKNTDSSFTLRYGAYCKAEDRFVIGEKNQKMYQQQPYLIVATGGGRAVIQELAQEESGRGTIVQETIEGNVIKHILSIGSQSINSNQMEGISDYRFLVGYLTANGQDVASIRMIPHIGLVQEDEVQDSTVLFLGEWSQPVTFEFYNPSHTLIATQLWDI